MRRTPTVLFVAVWMVAWPARGAVALPVTPLLQIDAVARVADASFRHARHESFSCLDCHTMSVGHGALRVQDVSDCRACHHVPSRSERTCTDCHEAEELGAVPISGLRRLDLTVRPEPVVRDIPFSHAIHRDRPCADCHTGGPTLAVPDLDCSACHQEHHDPSGTRCMTCHRPPPEDAHTLAVHQGCSGSGCHLDPPFASAPLTRVGCLWCHEDRVEHEPGRVCSDCHFVSSSPSAHADLQLRRGAR